MDLRDLYQDIILDHGRHPRHFHRLAAPSHLAHGHNPLCGDQLTVYVTVSGDDVITEASFEGQGCAISVASASLMTDILQGKTLDEARLLFAEFHASVTGGPPPNLPETLADDAERLHPLTGVKAYPARVKCATLAWHTFDAALRRTEHASTA